MFDESLRSCEDFDLWLRIVKNGGRIIYHRRRLALYRRYEGSLSSDRIWMMRHLLAVFEKCANTLDLTPAETATVNEEIIRGRAMLSLFEGKRALSTGAANTALAHFEKANEHLRNPKLSLVVFFLRHLPRLVVWGFTTRERLRNRQADYQLSGFDHPHTTSSAEAIGGTRESRMYL